MQTRPLDRRHVLGLISASAVACALPARAQDAPPTDDIVIGSEDASVTVYEYSSFTCPHCASFHRNTWPEVKENYVDTGKVKFILREVYFDPYGLWASMLARCGGRDSFYAMADQFMTRQDEWARAEDVAAALQKIGRLNGLSASQMRECLTDESYAKALVARYQAGADEHNIRSTPSFVIDGSLHAGDMPYDEFSALLDKAL
jgi:protein-disulfide isomerase